MSEHASDPALMRSWIVPMRPRSRTEAHRAATPLELFFDLVFVVAVAQAAGRLHHGLVEGHASEAIVSYAMVFFAIWWAWMNCTWFASAYDTDDIPYRLAVFVQLIGVLILAAGVPRAFDGRDFRIVAVGYVVMRLALVLQWLRAARSDPSGRRCAYRYAIGVSVCQIGWVLLVFTQPAWWIAGFIALAIVELLIPAWAERPSRTSWHPGHITERYGLFTIIVLGESILAASQAIQSAIETGDLNGELLSIIAGGLLIVFSMWWMYFDQPAHHLLDSSRTVVVWGYGHLPIFAAAAAVGVGLAVAVDQATHHAEIGSSAAGATVTIPVAIYLMCLWALHQRQGPISFTHTFLFPIVCVLILLTSASDQAVLLTGLLLVALMTIKLVSRYREGARSP